MNEAERQGLAYARAGVDIDAGNRLGESITAHGSEPVVYAGRLDLAW
jgi:hypothetical protein